MLCALTNVSLLPQRMLDEPLRPRLIECAFVAPGRPMTAELRKSLPFRFGCRRNCVVFDSAIAGRPIPTADIELQRLIIQLAEQQLRGDLLPNRDRAIARNPEADHAPILHDRCTPFFNACPAPSP